MRRIITTPGPDTTALVKEAWQDVGASFERFCLTAGIATLSRMMTEDAERLLVQGAETGDTVVMERLAEHLDKANRRSDATGWLRRAAEAGDTIAMQQLAARLDEDGEPDDAERWLVQAAEADDHFAHFVRIQLYTRLAAAGRPDDADEWLRRDIEAMLAAGMDEGRIRRGLAAWHGSGDKAARLRSYVEGLR